VPHYYFNVSCSDFESVDLVGQCCRDDVAALQGALRTAGAVLQKRLRAGGLDPNGWVEVEDEHHRPVLKLPLRAACY
jgi:hypothetical protein